MFDPAFFEAAAQLGKRDARAELDRRRGKDRKLSWRTEPIEL